MKRNSNSKEQLDEFIDVEKQQYYANYRGSEGQDTITPLTNNVFLKQISKLKHYAGSSKSITSANSTSDLGSSQNLNKYQQHTSSATSIKSSSNDSKERVPKTFANLFRTKSNQSLSDIAKSSNYLSKMTSVASSTNKLNSVNLFRQLSKLDVDENEMHSINNLNKTDIVFDELSDIILNKSTGRKVYLDDEFRKNINLIVQQTEMNKKHQIDKVRCTCKFFMFMFFLFMFFFLLFFLYELHSISSKILNQSNTTTLNYNNYILKSTT